MKQLEEKLNQSEVYFINIDIEAVDVAETASVVSIGASVYDRFGKKRTDGEFSCDIDWVSSIKNNARTASVDTLLWWHSSKVSDKSRAVLDSQSQVSLPEALVMLQNFISQFSTDNAVIIFSKGPDYDMKILQSSYDALGIPIPWKREQQACVRTMIILGFMNNQNLDLYPNDQDAHSALVDADHQGGLVVNVLRDLGLLESLDHDV